MGLVWERWLVARCLVVWCKTMLICCWDQMAMEILFLFKLNQFIANVFQLNKFDLDKLLVLVEKRPTPPLACYQFDAEIVVLFHSTTIRINYQPVIQCLSIRQAARIVKMSTDVLRTGDKATVTFRFMYRPEYMHTGVRLVIREGTTRGMGVVTKLYRGTPAELDAAGDDLSAFEVDAPLIDKKTNGNTSSNSTTSSASASVPPAPQTAKV